ncbi:uncharacterized protein LOC141641010 [Silene latifolia]|uniref:uncharacterized protein LOC141641010 n=1 Tax=Silene latifolia TaxID=37657 RepID=UPI003D786778
MLEGWSVTTNSNYHKGGRVWLLWRPSLFDVQVLAYDAQFVHAKVISRITLQAFHLTMIYAFNDGQDRKVLWQHLEQFQTQCSATCGMTDIPATGAYYTWTNKQEPQSRVYSILDRFLINQEWGDQFPNMAAHNHPAGLFDHSPCIVSHNQIGGMKRASFKYFNMWGKAPTFIPKVYMVWQQEIPGHKMFCVVKKLKALKPVLKEINRECFSDIENATVLAEKELYAEIKISDSLRRLTEARDSFLLQKAKVKWTEHGDSNSAYFHGVIRRRCNQNKVIQIEDQNGVIFFETPIDKSPGPDGFTSGFFRDSWEIVGDDICAAIKDFFHTGILLNQINATNITLIPKCDRPTSVKQFRPIACCNMIYKAMSKLLCNRLALVLPGLISANQGGFIKGRSIIENVLICQDIVKLYNRKAVSPRCLFKIDLQKAYDTVEWGFVEQLFQKMGFPEDFTHRVMTCVKSTSFSLCLNGSSFGYFKGKRGLKQGDPISPLIFTMCMEYLTRMINFATDRWPFQYHPLCKGIKLNHLIFADDLLMFCKGNAQFIILMIRDFSSFSKAAGLFMNNNKSEVYFNGVTQDLKNDIQQVTGLVEGSMPFRYLRVPIQAGKLTKKECNILTKKMVNRIRSLGAKKLSYAGRIMLIKSVLNILYSYWAGIFLIPKAVIKRIEAICRNFLWDGSSDYHRVPLVAWDTVTLPKEEGGLGIKKAETWNVAIVAKLVDWIYGKADRLWIRWINQIYLKNGDWHSYKPPADAAWAWKDICKVKELMKTAYIHSQWTPDSTGYTVRHGYEWLRHTQPKKDWYNVVWNKWNVPKHAIITWLYMNKGLNVRDKLHKIGYCQEKACCICKDADETEEHLFFSWRMGVKSQAHAMIWAACCYYIWQQRNNARTNGVLVKPAGLAERMIKESKHRIKSMVGRNMQRGEREWLNKWGCINSIVGRQNG